MTLVCRIVAGLFALGTAGALALFAVGTFGLFGQEPGPLAGVFLIPVGLPWNLLVDGLPEGPRTLATVAAPVLNLVLLGAACHFLSKKRTAQTVAK